MYQFLLLFLSFFSSAYPQGTSPKVLLAVTGFSSERTSISLDDLKSQYCQNEVFVLKEVKEQTDAFFACSCENTLENTADFQSFAQNNILILDLENAHHHFPALNVEGISLFDNPQDYPFVYETQPQKKINLTHFLGNIYEYELAQNDSLFFLENQSNGGKIILKEIPKFLNQNALTEVIITGVTAITRRTGETANAQGVDYLTEAVRSEFQTADFVHISNEVSFTADCEYIAGTSFCTKKAHFQALLDLNANIIELTGNHNRDYGNEAFYETFAWYQEQGMQTFGGGLDEVSANQPLIITLKDGKKIGFIGFNEWCPLGECATGEIPGANAYDAQKAQKVIAEMRQEVDYIIASVQFRESYQYHPLPIQESISRDLIDFGADLVYGSQAHQVQEIEFYRGKTILYGLGNFIFDQQFSAGVRQGFFIRLFFYEGKLIQAIPVYTMISDARPILAAQDEIIQIQEAILKEDRLYK